MSQQCFLRDWDDPRLFTLTALRRRGFPPEAINNFCARVGTVGWGMWTCPPSQQGDGSASHPAGWCDSGPGDDGTPLAGGVCEGCTEWARPPRHGRAGAPQGHHHQLPSPPGEAAVGRAGLGAGLLGQRSPPAVPQAIDVLVPNFPADESRGFHKVPFQSVVYIEESDCKEVSRAQGH